MKTINKSSPESNRYILEVDKLLPPKGPGTRPANAVFLVLPFRHGLRVSEACGLILSVVDIESRVLHVARLKKGLSTTKPPRSDEIEIIKSWLAERSTLNAEYPFLKPL
jgi:type 1 fimbriae regulatory protein FimB